ncbi:MAG: di-trans,poly-cis-decaprenylcistransferase [Candidatus Yonathbacteria bacterium]|nr:di-trans,poly-cis-decaprenylcistransferase [Candidatus Yonathbacteria bacterium]
MAKTTTVSQKDKTPRCIGVIMDGNRRWAKARGLPVFMGHSEGYKKFKEFIRWARNCGAKYVIAYAFSTENWKRSESEVKQITELLRMVLDTEIESLKQDGIRLRFIGNIEKFPADVVKKVHQAEKETAHGATIEVVVALSYGGRDEIVSAIKKLTKSDIQSLTEKSFSDHLSTKGIPDPDIIIRTGGDIRLSNFLLWQSAYSELFFTKTLWSDLSEKEFNGMVDEFSSRDRRKGK